MEQAEKFKKHEGSNSGKEDRTTNGFTTHGKVTYIT